MGVDVSFGYYVFFLPLIWLFLIIPISVGGFGIREGAFALREVTAGTNFLMQSFTTDQVAQGESVSRQFTIDNSDEDHSQLDWESRLRTAGCLPTQA